MAEPQKQQVPQTKPTNTYAIVSLVASIMGFMGFALVGPILGIVFGQMAKKQITQSGEEGMGLASAGVILGIIQLVMTVLLILGIAAAFILAALGSSA